MIKQYQVDMNLFDASNLVAAGYDPDFWEKCIVVVLLITRSLKSSPGSTLLLPYIDLRLALLLVSLGIICFLPSIRFRHFLISIRHCSRVYYELATWRPPILWIFASSDIIDDHCPSEYKACGGDDAWNEPP